VSWELWWQIVGLIIIVTLCLAVIKGTPSGGGK
jgi:hypothetical protein